MGIIVSLILFFSAVIIHECSHAFIAYKLGDRTAQRMGRLTLNPLAHIDPFGTILLPILLLLMNSRVLFGWAKPVPVNFSSLKNPKRDMMWVGFAGPAANFICAFIAALIIKLLSPHMPVACAMLEYFMLINIVLAIFNLIPIPPLDGSRVLMGLLPFPAARALAQLEPYGFILLFALLYMGIFDKVVWPISAQIINILLHL